MSFKPVADNCYPSGKPARRRPSFLRSGLRKYWTELAQQGWHLRFRRTARPGAVLQSPPPSHFPSLIAELFPSC